MVITPWVPLRSTHEVHWLTTLQAPEDPRSCSFLLLLCAGFRVWRADGSPSTEANQLESIFVVWTGGCVSRPEDTQRKRKSEWPHFFFFLTKMLKLELFDCGHMVQKSQSTLLRFLYPSGISYFSLFYTKCGWSHTLFCTWPVSFTHLHVKAVILLNSLTIIVITLLTTASIPLYSCTSSYY